MTNKTPEQMIAEIHGVLFNQNGHKGLCQQVQDNTTSINRIYIVLAVIVAASGGGGYAIISKLLMG